MPTFGQLLKKHRDRLDVGTYRLGKLVHVDGSYISRLETGNRMPSRAMVGYFADVFQLQGWEREDFYGAAGFLSPEAQKGL